MTDDAIVKYDEEGPYIDMAAGQRRLIRMLKEIESMMDDFGVHEPPHAPVEATFRCTSCGSEVRGGIGALLPEDHFCALTTREMFHRLWTKAVGTPSYDKKEWQILQRTLFGDGR